MISRRRRASDRRTVRAPARRPRRRCAGYTVLELVAALAVLGTLAGIFLPNFLQTLRQAKLESCVAQMRVIELQISVFFSATQQYPVSLDDLGAPQVLDPWGHPYGYLRIEQATRGQWRKDRFLVPLNSDYDLYSMGPDGDSRAPLTARASRDDIVRAGNGAFLGKAEEY